MDIHTKDELLKLFSVSLALVACSMLVFMARTPSLTGAVVIHSDDSMTMASMALLILAGLAVVMVSLMSMHKKDKELESHRKIIYGTNSIEEYVKKAREHGFNDAQIELRLKKANLDDEEIKKII